MPARQAGSRTNKALRKKVIALIGAVPKTMNDNRLRRDTRDAPALARARARILPRMSTTLFFKST